MDQEVREFLLRHLMAIHENDSKAYHETTSEELTLYEWWITPNRLDGLSFHDFMMAENTKRGAVFGVESHPSPYTEPPHTRYDLANLCIQRYGDTAIASYTMLISIGLQEGVKVLAHNESRVIVKGSDGWKVVHVHKSPAWPAPHVQD